MHPRILKLAVSLLGLLAAVGCKRKASPDECSGLVSHYAELVVRETKPDASPETVAGERTRELTEAQQDEAFRNCPTEVTADELSCAMRATTTQAVLHCLE